MRSIGNYLKEDKDFYIQAAGMSGQDVEWRDEPTDASLRETHGSLWSDEADLSRFWQTAVEMRKYEK